ncbi:carboxypeptidase-like regulatory domain-containing protein [Prolixibacteraceae bacterium Z1-6]|uniref:Carboxypeptidase-like regulatory domain-containing protein n=1 Tax=Draconibacterium aestuarii TaxID=2998507 RepID=A0A9X3J877_9BACT|nr:carboxypeptidase-like regulatory domain-containing protein [Prolixibacteraceae bacterium Z1-6]
MKTVTILIFSLVIFSFATTGQVSEVVISGNFNNESFASFSKTIETLYPVQFFYNEKDVKSLVINGNFRNEPVPSVLYKIFESTSLHYAIKNNQIFIYSGEIIQPLFLEPEKKEPTLIEKTEDELDYDRWLTQQYELVNIGVPGSHKTGYASVYGTVGVYKSANTVPGCNVYTKEEKRGTSTDSKGNYTLKLPLGNHTLIYSSVGMEPTQRIINLYANGRLDVEMEAQVNLIADVEVLGKDKGNLNRVELGMEQIDMKAVNKLPKLLGESDIIKSTLILPGVTTVGEGASGFNVRGGKTDQNLILVDHTPIYYPSHFFGNFSAINSDVVNDANLYKGSFPAKYGGRISSVYQINTKKEVFTKFSGSGGISPLSGKLMLQGPIKKQTSSFLLSVRSTYSDWLLKQVTIDQLYNSSVNFYDVQTKFNFKLSDKNKLVINAYGSEDGFTLRSDTTYNYYNILGSAALETNLSDNWKMINSLSLSAFGYKISSASDSLRAFDILHSLQNYAYKNITEYTVNSNLKFSGGGELQLYLVNPGEREVPDDSDITPFYSKMERGLEYGLFASAEFYPSEKLKVESGIRLAGYFALADGEKNIYAEDLPRSEDNLIETIETKANSIDKHYVYPEFRFSSNYSVNRYTALKFSYNITTQFLHMLTNTTAISPTDTWKLSDEYLKPQRGQSLSAGVVRSNYLNTLEMSVEGFYKRMTNIKEYKAGADLMLNNHIETEILNGKGKSYGAEFSLQKNGGRFYGRLGYTYSRTLIKTESDFEEEVINDGEYFPANYDKPHNLNVLANFEPVRGIVLSLMTNYSTGRPITYPVSKYKLGDQIILHYSKYNEFRIPDYFRMDVSVTVDRNLKKDKLIDGSWSFSVYNLTGRKNAYSVYYRSKGAYYEGYKLSIFGTAIPTITYNFKF